MGIAVFLFCGVSVTLANDCVPNGDLQYDRSAILMSFLERVIKDPGYTTRLEAGGQKTRGFDVYDLVDGGNTTRGGKCIEFKEGHIYHFSSTEFRWSVSHIAILKHGEVKIFSAINCGNIIKNLREVTRFANRALENREDKKEVLIRLSFYRRYAYWVWQIDPLVNCNSSVEIPENRYGDSSRNIIIEKWSRIARAHVPDAFDGYVGNIPVENQVVDDIYIQDLSDLNNKQDSVVSPIILNEGHLYQFGLIDLPYSLTHFAVLKNGEINYFTATECRPKMDRLEQLTMFIEENIESRKEVRKMKERIREYEKYRIATPLAGATEPNWLCTPKSEYDSKGRFTKDRRVIKTN